MSHIPRVNLKTQPHRVRLFEVRLAKLPNVKRNEVERK
jgi:hypothetical protein